MQRCQPGRRVKAAHSYPDDDQVLILLFLTDRSADHVQKRVCQLVKLSLSCLLVLFESELSAIVKHVQLGMILVAVLHVVRKAGVGAANGWERCLNRLDG